MLVGRITVVVWKEFIWFGSVRKFIPGFLFASGRIYVVSLWVRSLPASIQQRLSRRLMRNIVRLIPRLHADQAGVLKLGLNYGKGFLSGTLAAFCLTIPRKPVLILPYSSVGKNGFA